MTTQQTATICRPTFWKALDGKIGLGFDFTQQNAKTDFTLTTSLGWKF